MVGAASCRARLAVANDVSGGGGEQATCLGLPELLVIAWGLPGVLMPWGLEGGTRPLDNFGKQEYILILGAPRQGRGGHPSSTSARKSSNGQACCWEGEHHSPSQFGFLNLAHAEPGPINIPGCHQASSRAPHGPRAWARPQVGAGSSRIQAGQGPGLPCSLLYH